MKKQLFSLQGFMLLSLIAIFTSCGLLDSDEIEVLPVFDCPQIQAMVGDSCTPPLALSESSMRTVPVKASVMHLTAQIYSSISAIPVPLLQETLVLSLATVIV